MVRKTKLNVSRANCVNAASARSFIRDFRFHYFSKISLFLSFVNKLKIRPFVEYLKTKPFFFDHIQSRLPFALVINTAHVQWC